MTVELGLTPDGRWDIDVPDYLDAARDAGFSTVGLGGARATAEAAAALAIRDMGCHEVLALMVGRDEEATLTQARQLAAAAAAVSADWVLTIFRTRLTPEALDLIARATDVIAEAGARIAVEFSPLSPVDSIPLALTVVEAAGPDRSGVMIDSWHYFHGPSTWDDLASIPMDRIAYVQFDDALAPASEDGMDETMNRRAMPGDGVLELDRFATTLLDRGFDGVVSVEVLSSELAKLSVPEFAQRAYESTARYWL